MDRALIESGYRDIQTRFIEVIERLDGTGFISDEWERPGGGGGVTRVLSGAGPIEKAAVNFSAVGGAVTAQLDNDLLAGSTEFYATGVSIIVHPRNPHAPTFHANLRYFESDGEKGWFGGGADLTPHYLYEDDARHFHGSLKAVCDRHDVADYRVWKQTCDEYFHLPHRGEARGIGGIFFARLTERLEEVWDFQKDLGEGLVDAYLPILERRIDQPYGDAESLWQEIRRGRYVEFNLVWDRGTRFGLESSGRTESILASLPPRARWVYGHEPLSETPEATLLELLRGEPRDWV